MPDASVHGQRHHVESCSMRLRRRWNQRSAHLLRPPPIRDAGVGGVFSGSMAPKSMVVTSRSVKPNRRPCHRIKDGGFEQRAVGHVGVHHETSVGCAVHLRPEGAEVHEPSPVPVTPPAGSMRTSSMFQPVKWTE